MNPKVKAQQVRLNRRYRKDLRDLASDPGDQSAAECAALEAWLLNCPCDLTTEQKRQVWRVLTTE